MKFYLKNNVYDAALDRIRWLFDEFENIIVSVSGGKDSTVVFELTMMVAKEKGRLPLKVMFIDQEAEWQATIDQIRLIMERPDVIPYWYQCPIKLFNATSSTDHWLYCWRAEDEVKWMRPRESYSIKDNIYGTDRFAEFFTAVINTDQRGLRTANIGGVRGEESPRRFIGLTGQSTYKGVTWGKVLDKKQEHFTFYPIYDWSYTDVWKAIHDNQWNYNAIYDAQYAFGVSVMQMRVSNLHHETAVKNLFYMQEVEHETHVKLTNRIGGIDTATKMGTDDYFVKDLPFMFKDWTEYRDFLLDKLIDNPEWKETMRKGFKRTDSIFNGTSMATSLHKTHVNCILTNDWELIKLKNFESSPKTRAISEIRQGNVKEWNTHGGKS